MLSVLTAIVSEYTLFRTMQNGKISETYLIEAALEAIRRRLPKGWWLGHGRHRYDEWINRNHRADEIFEIMGPRGDSAVIYVEIKRSPIEARHVISQIRDYWNQQLVSDQENDSNTGNSIGVMAVAPYIGPSARDRLSEAGISFADLTGNVRFTVDRPAVFIEAQGADRNPYRENVPLRTLRGKISSRVVRGLLDYCPPFGVRELAKITKTSAASVSRVSELLEREAILYRETPRGRIISVDWERLLRRWADDYDFLNANDMMSFIEPRGMRLLFNKLRDADFDYAVTGSFAATRLAPVAEPRLAAIYAQNPVKAAARLGLRPADTGGNVLLGRPFDPVVFDHTELDEGITYVRVTQVAADLMSGPGRGPAEAESIIDWMRYEEDRWQLSLMKAM